VIWRRNAKRMLFDSIDCDEGRKRELDHTRSFGHERLLSSNGTRTQQQNQPPCGPSADCQMINPGDEWSSITAAPAQANLSKPGHRVAISGKVRL
jgi:hypothetical protein